jgi:hypothetical protein
LGELNQKEDRMYHIVRNDKRPHERVVIYIYIWNVNIKTILEKQVVKKI